jgi:hypothetical protein
MFSFSLQCSDVDFIFVGCILLRYLRILYEHIIYMIYIYICNPQLQLFFFISFVTSLHVTKTELMLIHLFHLKMARRGRNM